MAGSGDLTGLEAGTQLAAVPIDQLITTLGIGVANAQRALDDNSIATAVALSTTTMDVDDQKFSLLSLGFTPTFYAFTEVTMEIRIEMKMQVEETEQAGVDASISGEKGTVAMSSTMTAEKSRKYGAESSAMTAVHITMVSVEAPQEFMNFIQRLDRGSPSAETPA